MKKVWVMLLTMGNKYSVRVFKDAEPACLSANYYNKKQSSIIPIKATVVCLPITKGVKFLEGNTAPFYIEEE